MKGMINKTKLNSIIFGLTPDEPIIVIDEIGFKYKGELIEDAGEIYKIFKDFIENRVEYTEEQIREALSEAFKANQEGYDITSDEIIQSIKRSKKY